jgi:hypothetical protein
MVRTTLAAMGAAALACLSACATVDEPLQYGPIGTGGYGYGYQDSANQDGSFTVVVITPNDGLGRQFFERRAEELCPAGIAQQSIFRVQQRLEMATGYSGTVVSGVYQGSTYTYPTYGAIMVEGMVRCAPTTAEAKPDPAPAPTLAPAPDPAAQPKP